jgi:hypothetical protein
VSVINLDPGFMRSATRAMACINWSSKQVEFANTISTEVRVIEREKPYQLESISRRLTPTRGRPGRLRSRNSAQKRLDDLEYWKHIFVSSSLRENTNHQRSQHRKICSTGGHIGYQHKLSPCRFHVLPRMRRRLTNNWT